MPAPRSISYPRLLAGIGVLSLLFIKPLWDLAMLAKEENLHSHLPMVPAICIYLVFLLRRSLPGPSAPAWGLIVPALVAGVAAVYRFDAVQSAAAAPEDLLWPAIFSWVCLVLAWTGLSAGRDWVRVTAFPLAFLVLTVPLPTGPASQISIWLQHASADVTFLFIKWTGTPIFREDMVFTMPGLVIEVAEACSGIRSSLVLFITALLAGYLLLDATWKRIVLVLLIFPLGVLRNAFRILTLSWLTIHVDPGIIDGPLHHRGGPIFFVLSLVVLFAALFLLRRMGRGVDSSRGRDEETGGEEVEGIIQR